MEIVSETQPLTTDPFIDAVNKLRKKAKNGWYQWTGMVNGKAVEIKGYKTWLQIFRVNGQQQTTTMDIPVSKFVDCLRESVAIPTTLHSGQEL